MFEMVSIAANLVTRMDETCVIIGSILNPFGRWIFPPNDSDLVKNLGGFLRATFTQWKIIRSIPQNLRP